METTKILGLHYWDSGKQNENDYSGFRHAHRALQARLQAFRSALHHSALSNNYNIKTRFWGLPGNLVDNYLHVTLNRIYNGELP